MPDNEFPKLWPHPAKADRSAEGTAGFVPAATPYAELSVTSNFTFLTGASHPEELVQQAALLGHRAVAITDTNTLAGIVRAHVAAKQAGIQLVVGCRLQLSDGLGLLVYPTDRPAYSRLCRLLTLGKRRAPKGECDLSLHDAAEHSDGMLCVVEPPAILKDRFIETVQGLRRVFTDDRLSVSATFAYSEDDTERVRQVASLARHVGVPMAASNRVLYHEPGRRPLQDILTCIRSGCTIQQAGLRLEANSERHIKATDEMARLFAEHPEAIQRTVEIAERAASFSLDHLRYEYPVEPCPPGLCPKTYLEREVMRGAATRYGDEIPSKTRDAIAYELTLINELGYEAYFLTCYDIVTFARSRGILCQGRGGAANSAVCYCLGITEVDPATHSLLFERFISRERGEPPDIDIDFEHERREEVLQYIYRKYGRDRAAMTAEVISYRGRSAIREVAKAMGLSYDCIDALAKNLDRWGETATEERVREAGLNPRDPTIRQVLALTQQLTGFPRHLSQHVGGMVITRGDLCDLVPIENAAMEDRTVIEWDKDDIDAMGMLKVDCLGLGMLTCIRKTFGMLDEIGVHGPLGAPLTIADVMSFEREDDEVYEMIGHADTIGVFQIESRAQMSMLPRLKPRCFYDLVIEVAIVRPGPIQGGMVHPYLRRREGTEPVNYPNPEVRAVLERTLGVPLFQEQAMQLAIVAAGFTPDQADGLRRSMAAWKRNGNAIYRYGQQLIDGMLANGYTQEFAERCFEQIKGFSEYGFPESHAASFAILVYVSCWLKRHHPAAFAAALINSQPMGFYKPAQIIRDAQDHGIGIEPIDANRSRWHCTIDAQGRSIRLGTRLAKGMPEAEADAIAEAVAVHGPFSTVESLWRESGVSTRALRSLAQADAFGSMGLDRQQALWQVRPLRDAPLPLFERADTTDAAGLDHLPSLSTKAHVLSDYQATGLSLKSHPMSFLREDLDSQGVLPTSVLRSETACPQGRAVSVAGLVLCRQRPGTASGVTFVTLEDEFGIANLLVWRDTFERFRRVGRLASLMLARGRVERAGEVVHVHVRELVSLDDQLDGIGTRSRDFH